MIGRRRRHKRRRAGGRQPSPEVERATASHAWSVMRVLLSAAAPAAQVLLTENSGSDSHHRALGQHWYLRGGHAYVPWDHSRIHGITVARR